MPPEKWDLLLQIGDYYGADSRLDHHYLSVAWASSVVRYIPKALKKVLVIGADYDEVKSLEMLGYDATGFGIQDNEYDDIKYVKGDMHNIPFEKREFDAVISRGAFEHGHAPWLQALEIRRVLKNGGRLHLDVPKWDDPTLGMYRTDYHHPMVLHPVQLKRIFHFLGFELVEEEEDIRFWWEKKPVEGIKAGRIRKVIERYEEL